MRQKNELQKLRQKMGKIKSPDIKHYREAKIDEN